MRVFRVGFPMSDGRYGDDYIYCKTNTLNFVQILSNDAYNKLIGKLWQKGGKNVQYYDKKAVGARIKKIRKSRNITQSKLSEYLDYTSERQLQRIESGETACSVDKLMEIAQILNTSTDFLLFGKEQISGSEFAIIFEGKNERQKAYLRKIMEVAANNLEMVM